MMPTLPMSTQAQVQEGWQLALFNAEGKPL